MHNMSKQTKQGVRDLNHLKGSSGGRRPDPLPESIEQDLCKHRSIKDIIHNESGYVIGSECNHCGKYIDLY